MSAAKIAISMDKQMLKQLDELVKDTGYPSRSRAIQDAVHGLIERKYGNRLARECAKLDPEQEMAIAEEGLNSELDRIRKAYRNYSFFCSCVTNQVISPSSA